MQPERRTFNFGGPHAMLQVEYWVGNRSVERAHAPTTASSPR